VAGSLISGGGKTLRDLFLDDTQELRAARAAISDADHAISSSGQDPPGTVRFTISTKRSPAPKTPRFGVAPPATNTQHTVIDSPASEIAPPASALPVHPKMKTVPVQLRHVPNIWEMDIQKQVPDHLRDEYTRRVHHSDSVVDPVATFRELTGKDPTAHSWISPEFSPEQLQEMWHRHKQEQIDRTAAIMRGEDVDY
jgi:hypothetical protein